MHATGGFFDGGATPEPEEFPQPLPSPWLTPPADELPGRVLLDRILFRTDALVLVLRELRRHSTGIVLDLSWSSRRSGQTPREFQQQHNRLMMWDEDTYLRAGVVLPDGSSVLPIHLTGLRDPHDVQPPTVFLQRGGSGGGADRYDGESAIWLWWPDAQPGDLELVIDWPELGVPELHVQIPAADREAASAPRPLWDD